MFPLACGLEQWRADRGGREDFARVSRVQGFAATILTILMVAAVTRIPEMTQGVAAALAPGFAERHRCRPGGEYRYVFDHICGVCHYGAAVWYPRIGNFDFYITSYHGRYSARRQKEKVSGCLSLLYRRSVRSWSGAMYAIDWRTVWSGC